ncbi:MAG: hypoxanthine phosphoribosyltransferase [Deltaproteobacteria bacterium]|nr:hypoxanthine phosphoribosyltransferase [Deltaproteobacteria bacterium]
MVTKSPRVMFSAEALAARVSELGRQITADYAGSEVTVVGVLNGSFVFMADLVRAIDLPIRCDFLGLSSYGSATESSGVVAITKDLSGPIEGRHLLIVEDIVDTGLTMAYLMQNLATRRPASVKLVSLLSKPARRQVDVVIDYLGFTIEDRFVVGYGLDYDGRYRNLPFIGVFGD